MVRRISLRLRRQAFASSDLGGLLDHRPDQLGAERRTPSQLCGQCCDSAQRGWTDVMFHPFDVVIDHAIVEAEKSKKISEQFMASRNVSGQCFARCCQDQSAILLVFEQAFAIEALYHVGYAGL